MKSTAAQVMVTLLSTLIAGGFFLNRGLLPSASLNRHFPFEACPTTQPGTSDTNMTHSLTPIKSI